MKWIYISFRKRIFQFFFLFISMFWLKMKENAKNILTFYGNSFFSLKIAQIIPIPAFLEELISYLRNTIFYLVQKKEIYAISRKKFFFTEKVSFSMISCLFHCLHKKNHNKIKNWILWQYTFSEKSHKWRVFQRF